MDRRQFLKVAGAGGVALAALPILIRAQTAEATPATQAAGNTHGFVSGRLALDLDNSRAGGLHSVEGGHAIAEVVMENVGLDHIQRKHLAGVKYEDITVTCGTGMSKQFYQWIKDSFNHKYTRQNGAIIGEHACLTFTNAFITEVGMPALDAASKDAATMTITWRPETTRHTRGGGGGSGGPIRAKEQKKWLTSNFRLRIGDLEEACKRVNKIEALVVKPKTIADAGGERRDDEQEPTHLEVPNLVITLPELHAKPFYDWHEHFVIKGNNGPDQEKSGTLEYLAPDLGKDLFTLTFSHLGIFKLTPEKVEAGGENIRRLKAEMYCEEITFNFSNAVVPQ
jgi:hypothetical protein